MNSQSNRIWEFLRSILPLLPLFHAKVFSELPPVKGQASFTIVIVYSIKTKALDLSLG